MNEHDKLAKVIAAALQNTTEDTHNLIRLLGEANNIMEGYRKEIECRDKLLEHAWSLISNVRGDQSWWLQAKDWQRSAETWRNLYQNLISTDILDEDA